MPLSRQFTVHKAVRSKVPLLIGLYGPSGSGKTFSAHRLARGVQRVVGGRIRMIDTENKRGLHYAADFDFDHIPFDPPFSLDDYAAAMKFAAVGSGVVIVDSTSHLWEGPGGLLEWHSKEVDRMGGDKHNFPAWSKPKQALAAFVQQTLLRVDCGAFIFCYRAKEKLKFKPGQQPKPMGWMPIIPDEFAYEMTINALLPPASNGVPQWKGSEFGEEMMIKLPGHFRELLSSGKPLDENMGEQIARWAAGDAAPKMPDMRNDGPRFIKQFNGMGGKQFSEATMEQIAAYATWLEQQALRDLNKQQRDVIDRATTVTQGYIDAEMAAEADRVRQSEGADLDFDAPQEQA